jgi:hypothetical protein
VGGYTIGKEAESEATAAEAMAPTGFRVYGLGVRV